MDLMLELTSMPRDLYAVWSELNQVCPAFLVGGAARDLILGHVPHDWDIATAMRPDEIMAWGKTRGLRVVPTGLAYGTVTLITHTGQQMQVTAFRKEGRYRDGRHPQEVTFVETLAEDLSRRDFTINALAVTPTGRVIDHHGGMADIHRRAIAAVGNPRDRLTEDPLRMWRAVRFVGLDRGGQSFRIAPAVAEVIQQEKALLIHVSVERQRDELMKLLATTHFAEALREADRLGILGIVWPEWTATRHFAQHSPYHTKPVHEHLLATASYGPTPFFRLVGLLHDIAKPGCFLERDGVGHFYGHDEVGAVYVRQMLSRLAFDRHTIEYASRLIAWHLFPWESAGSKAIRRLLREEGATFVDDLLTLRRMDVLGSGRGGWDEEAAVRARVASLQETPQSLRLAVTGHEVMAWTGLSPGPLVGQILQALADWVDDDPTRNTPGRLRAYVEARWPRSPVS